MATLKPTGMLYADSAFTDLMNANYFPVENMIASVQKLRAEMGEDYVRNIKWGDYQKRLTPDAQWPSPLAAQRWEAAVRAARASLERQPNKKAIAPDDARVPGDKCAYLDATIQKCFNVVMPGQTYPGIPIRIGVQERLPGDPDAALHDIFLSWVREPGTDLVRHLELTMVCPSEAAAGKTKKKTTRKAVSKAPRAGKAAKKKTGVKKTVAGKKVAQAGARKRVAKKTPGKVAASKNVARKTGAKKAVARMARKRTK
jgi:hypothetical protein